MVLNLSVVDFLVSKLIVLMWVRCKRVSSIFDGPFSGEKTAKQPILRIPSNSPARF